MNLVRIETQSLVLFVFFSENEAWYTPNSNKFEDAATKIEQWEDEPQTSEKKTMRNPKCNLRKSLAWDSAFFTSAGIFFFIFKFKIIELGF